MDHSEADHVTGHKPSWTRLHKPVWRCYPGGVEITYNTPATISKAYDKLGCEDYCTALILSLAIIINSLLQTTAEQRPLPLTSNRLFSSFLLSARRWYRLRLPWRRYRTMESCFSMFKTYLITSSNFKISSNHDTCIVIIEQAQESKHGNWKSLDIDDNRPTNAPHTKVHLQQTPVPHPVMFAQH